MKIIPSIINISKQYVLDNFDSLLSLEHNWVEIGEKAWEDRNFLQNIPMKWELSFAAEFNNMIIGYLIGSYAGKNNAKVNKFVVDKDCRRMGIGRTLLETFEKSCLQKGIIKTELKALVNNKNANKFYISQNYEKIGEITGDDGKIRNHYRKNII